MPVDPRTDIPEPLWPTQRGLERYNSLLGVYITTILAGGGMWIDVGPGAEALPMHPFLDRAEVALKSIGSYPRTLPGSIEFTLGEVPANTAFLSRYAGRATLVTDVYSSISYSEDPLLALVYCGLLLESGGTCGAFTELERIGGLATWDRAIQFFRRELHIAVSFEALSIVEDASRSVATALRIKARRERVEEVSLAEVGARLHARVGHPVPSGTIWEAPDQSARIVRVDYV